MFVGGHALCTADTIKGSNVVDNGNGKVRTVGRCDLREDTKSLPDNLGQDDTNGTSINGITVLISRIPVEGVSLWVEGCVAVKHLHGAGTLQHIFDLRRPVLCGHGFCAMPNHAIIVDGEWISLKELCSSKWRSTHSVKWVNKLSVFGGRNRGLKVRAVPVDIVVTPYDMRIPIAITWMLHIAEVMSVFISVTILFLTFMKMGMTVSENVWRTKYSKKVCSL